MRTETSRGKKVHLVTRAELLAAQPSVRYDEMKRSLNRWRFDDAFAVIGEYLEFSRIGGSVPPRFDRACDYFVARARLTVHPE